MTPKTRSLLLLLLAEIAAMSLWFVAAASLPDLVREAGLSPARQAALSSAVQLGFVAGALVFAGAGLADRYDPRRVLALSAAAAALCNGAMLLAPPGGDFAVAMRAATGALLAGVYPVGMKLVTGWGVKDRGFLVGALVGALTLGSASPHLIGLLGGADWRAATAAASLLALLAAALTLCAGLGPHHARAARLSLRAMAEAWTNRRVRLAYAGYLGHMWELYAMWAWIGAASAASYAASMAAAEAERLGALTAFCAMAAGAPVCLVAGKIADRIGKAEVAALAMAASGSAALLAALVHGHAPWAMFAVAVVWGMAVIPDSAQFSALVADAAPPERAGSLMTLQTALGFALTFCTVQGAPWLAASVGWPLVLAAMALGPALGIVAMLRLRALGRAG